MNFADLLCAHLSHRARIRAEVLRWYEVTDANHDRVRRMEVVQLVARAMGVPVVDNFFHQQVNKACVALGAEMIKPRNKRFYRKLRRRAAS